MRTHPNLVRTSGWRLCCIFAYSIVFRHCFSGKTQLFFFFSWIKMTEQLFLPKNPTEDRFILTRKKWNFAKTINFLKKQMLLCWKSNDLNRILKRRIILSQLFTTILYIHALSALFWNKKKSWLSINFVYLAFVCRYQNSSKTFRLKN